MIQTVVVLVALCVMPNKPVKGKTEVHVDTAVFSTIEECNAVAAKMSPVAHKMCPEGALQCVPRQVIGKKNIETI